MRHEHAQRSKTARAILLKTRQLLSGAWKRPDVVWPCSQHDHATTNCPTCEALIASVLAEAPARFAFAAASEALKQASVRHDGRRP